MRDLQTDLAQIIDCFSSKEGSNESPVPGVNCVKLSQSSGCVNQYWRASLALVAQGSKEIALETSDVYRFDDAHYILTPIGLPVTSQILSASPEKPFLGLWVDFDPLVVGEVFAWMERESTKKTEAPLRAVFVNRATDQILRAAIRLGKLFETPEDALVLGPLVVKEIFYYILKGDDGALIRQFVRSGSKVHKISESIYRLKSNLSEDVDVAALAKEANMSRSAFFKYFNKVTALSPIQYQKRLRLLEARRLMVDESESAESAAFKVGYKSASQFNREYSRMFGDSPLQNALKIKEIGNHVLKFNL